MTPPAHLTHINKPWQLAGSFSSAVRVDHLIYVSGQLGAEPGGPEVPLEQQIETALRRLVEVVESAGGSVATIVKLNGYLLKISDFPVYDRIYRSVIATSPMPARATVQVGDFIPPLRVEVEGIAMAAD